MMGRERPPQASLFYTGVNLDKRVRSDHVLRKIAWLVDFDFVYGEVKESYGYNGNVLVAPPMIVKLMLLLVLLSATVDDPKAWTSMSRTPAPIPKTGQARTPATSGSLQLG